MKARYHRGLSPGLYFFRDSHGNEVDLSYKSGSDLTALEIKASSTYHAAFKKGVAPFLRQKPPGKSDPPGMAIGPGFGV
jgi:uncharacterized protein